MKNYTEKSLKASNGITLIALVITIIVLLILAGISISMLSGDNSILQKATDAKTNSDNAQIRERIQLAYHSALTEGKGSYTKDSLMEELKNEFKTDYDVDDSDDTNWIMKAQGQEVTIPAGEKKVENDISTTDRTEINIGDYVRYKAPAREEYNLPMAISGYTTNQAVSQEYESWRVLSKNNDGSIELVANVKNTNTPIGFGGALGYNNAVLVLNTICSELYNNSSKGITARSINLEDVAKQMKDRTKIETTAKNLVTAFEGVGNKPPSFKEINKDDNTITYKSGSYCPDINQYNIDESENYYTEPTSKISSNENDFTVHFTYYTGNISDSDFKDYDNTNSIFYNCIFQSQTKYWLATRTAGEPALLQLMAGSMNFYLRTIDNSKISAEKFYNIKNGSSSNENRVCPIVTLDGNVKIEIKEGNEETPHIVDTLESK